MNKSFKSIMNKSTGTYVAAGENAKSKGKSSKNKLATALASASMAISAAATMLSPVDAMAEEKTQASDYQADAVASTDGGEVSLAEMVLSPAADDSSIATVTDETSGKTVVGVQRLGAQLLGATPTGTSVLYDDSTNNSITFTGTAGTKIPNVAAGTISATSMDAVNGSQLFHLTDGTAQSNSAYIKVGGSYNGTDDAAAPNGIGIAIGSGAKAQDGMGGGIAIGAGASVQPGAYYGGMALGEGAYTTAGIAIGKDTNAGVYSIAMGRQANASGKGALSLGKSSAAAGASGVAIGQASIVTGDNSIAIGANSTTSASSSVALGDSSVAAVANTVSVGKVGSERRIVNVKAGDASSATSTDAVNGSQLFATNENVKTNTQDITTNTEAISSLNTQMTDAVSYDTTAHDTLKLSGTAGTKISNVANGTISAASMDAVNGSQLFRLTDGSTVMNSAYVKVKGAGDGTDNSVAANIGAVAIGANASANGGVGVDITAVGSGAKAGSGNNSGATAIGAKSVAYLDGAALGYSAQATGNHSVSIGVRSSAAAVSGVALGDSAKSNANGDIAIGGGAQATGDGTDAAIALGSNSSATVAGISIGTGAVASAKNSVALGGHAVADQANTVSVGSSSLKRKIVNVAAGDISSATSTDVVNGGQLFATNANVTSNTTDIDQNKMDIAANIKDITTNTTAIEKNTTNIGTINTQVGTLNTQMADAVKYDTSAHTVITLGAGAAVKITNLADGDVLESSKDAVNGAQLYAVKQSIASQGGTLSGAVTYDSAAQDLITVGGTSGATITGLKAGGISATSTDAVNGSQLNATNLDVAKNATDIATNKTDIEKNVTDIAANKTDIEKNVTDIAANKTDIEKNATDIGTLNTQVGSLNTQMADAVKYDTSAHSVMTLGGAAGTKITNLADGDVLESSKDAITGSQLYAVKQSIASQGGALSDAVAYDSAAHDVITIGGTSGATIRGVKAGDISDSSTDAVNGAQLNTVVQNVKRNTDDIASLSNSVSDFNNGFAGLARQDVLTRSISIGANADGNSISMAGTQGARTVSGVANGAIDASSTDAVNGAQLAQVSASTAAALGGGSGMNANGSVSAPTYTVGGTQVHDVGSAFDNIDGRVTQNSADIAGLKGDIIAVGSGLNPNGVSYDSADHNTVTLGGTAATDAVQLTNVKAGELSSTSTDAINGAQLNATNERVGVTETAIADYQAAGLGYMTINSSATSGSKPVASGQDAVAIGVNAAASGSNSVALGANSVADEANTVSVGSAGNERRVTNVAAGVNGTDGVNMVQMNELRRDVGRSMTALQRSAYGGVAAAMAMPNPTPSAPGKTVVGAGVANYKGYSAIAAGVTHRSANGKWLTSGAVAATPGGDAGVRAHLDYEF
jgi:autotransporter adhesin